MSGGTFQRHEVKFLLNRKQRMALDLAMQDHMQQDQYGESTICSLYYDTKDFRLIRRSMEKPVYKEKLRLRSYGPAQPDGTVFVELKKKYDGIVYKRRISMKEAQAVRYLAGETYLPEDSQIGREIDWFKKYYQELIPAVYLCYDRIAYFSREDEDLRVTLDRNIWWRDQELTLVSAPWGQQLLESGQSLLEIKTSSAIPVWLAKVLSKNNIRMTTFSKYGKAYAIMQDRNTMRERGVYCA